MSVGDWVRYLRKHQPAVCNQLTSDARPSPRLYTRDEALRLLRIGETTLFWLQRTGKLCPIRIGSRVLFNAAEIEHIAAKGATLTGTEKKAASERNAGSARPTT
jgi:hypothetical protein